MIDTSYPVEKLNMTNKNTLSESLGIEYIEVTPLYLKARMPVDSRTVQPLRLMHGGASAALAEMTGSMAAYLSIDRENYYCVGLEMKINHIKAVRSGYVFATATPLHQGFTTQVWQIDTRDENDERVAFSVLTMAIVPLDKISRSIIRDIFKQLD
ncbi:MAG TPA: hotdog fold thioesterase [Bacteroidia bacterium]|nr:hotdog fold thioesterase [Sphingobacteriales bacterium]HPD63975.1 hotdog fold thioesterase [Bacteroidia bacterium]HRS57664.1 hotdog fold thioesterase [Bacteroidia bacterium]HRU67962.1 hotdog fold thioesterase [Bacteroidia bacterium]